MNTQKYFILNEQEGDFRHLGTVIVRNDEELNAKVKEAIEDHFDCEVKKLPTLTIAEVGHTHTESYEFVVVINDTDDKDPDATINHTIEIIETWLY